MRVLTLNLLAPDKGDYQRRRPVLVEGLRTLRPDVVAFQEAVWGEGTDQAVDLLGPGYQVARTRSAADGVGACLASRWPLDAVREQGLQVTERTASMVWAAALAVEILAPPPLGPLLFVHHKPNWQYGYERERELQAVTTARFVEALVADRDLQVVLAGDFDDPPDAASIRFWTGEMKLERGRRIDYVMVRCGVHGPRLAVAGCQLAFDQPVGGVWASDHFGVVADLALPPRPPGSWD